MKVMVTGSAGYIGKFIIQALFDAGHHVIGVDKKEDGFSFQVDLTDKAKTEWIVNATKPDAIIHLASNASVPDSFDNPYLYLRDNLEIIHNLLASRHEIKRFVLASSASVYGDASPFSARILSPYGQSKRHAEEVCQWYARIQGFKFVALRYFNVCGGVLQCHEDESHILPLMMRAYQTGEKLSIFGDSALHGARDYVHVKDVARANLAALEVNPGQYDIATGNGTSIDYLITAFENEGFLIPHQVIGERDGDPVSLVSDRFSMMYGWEPTYSIQDIVKEYVSMVKS